MARGVPPQGAGGGAQQAAQTVLAQQSQHRQRQAQYFMEAHGQQRVAQAEQRAEELQARVTELESILATGLARSPSIDLDGLFQQVPGSGFDPESLADPDPEPVWEEYAPSTPPLPQWLVGRWQKQREQDAQARFARAREAWQAAEEQRAEQVAQARRAHEEQVAHERARVEAYNSRIARVTAGLRDREPPAVESFLRTVLSRMPLPADFPRRWEVTHDPAAEHVTLRLVLPRREVVPTIAGYEYHESSDELQPVPRPRAECAAVYHRVLAQMVLLAARDVLQAEQRLAGVTVVGLVDLWDPVSDEPYFGCLLRLPAEPTEVTGQDLRAAPPVELLRQLGARVSPDPYALVPLEDEEAGQVGELGETARDGTDRRASAAVGDGDD